VRRQSLDGEDMRVFRNREGNLIPMGAIRFEPGSAAIPTDSAQQLNEIAAHIAGKPNKIDVRGFAPELDAAASTLTGGPVKASTAKATARRLAYRRSRAVLLALEQRGIRHDRLRVTAETLRPDGEPAEPPDRVAVFALDQFAGELVGPRRD
jgi:hypothetical protein